MAQQHPVCFEELPQTTYKAGEHASCCVCLEDAEKFVRMLCMHEICIACAEKWFKKQTQSTCPTCRQETIWRDSVSGSAISSPYGWSSYEATRRRNARAPLSASEELSATMMEFQHAYDQLGDLLAATAPQAEAAAATVGIVAAAAVAAEAHRQQSEAARAGARRNEMLRVIAETTPAGMVPPAVYGVITDSDEEDSSSSSSTTGELEEVY